MSIVRFIIVPSFVFPYVQINWAEKWPNTHYATFSAQKYSGSSKSPVKIAARFLRYIASPVHM